MATLIPWLIPSKPGGCSLKRVRKRSSRQRKKGAGKAQCSWMWFITLSPGIFCDENSLTAINSKSVDALNKPLKFSPYFCHGLSIHSHIFKHAIYHPTECLLTSEPLRQVKITYRATLHALQLYNSN